MNYRDLGRTGWKVSDISFGAWAIGGTWGSVDDTESLAALHSAIDCGVNFIDTADVYGMGRSERLIAQLKRDRKEEIIVATKAGRRLSPHTADGYNERNLAGFIDDSLRHLATDCLDLVQLHCPPTECYYRPRPAELFFDQAKRRRVGILARVPLASGMLSGKFTRESQFLGDDHRRFNRHGEAFDVGETFSGVDFEAGLEAVEEIRRLLPAGVSMAQFALRWILMHDAVTCAIPGGKRPSQVRENCAASDLPPLSEAAMTAVRGIYDARIRAAVHQRW